MALTDRQAKYRAKAEILTTLATREQWVWKELKCVVVQICRRYEVDHFEMLRALGLG